MSNINQELADDYAGIATGAAKLSAQATAESMKHQFAASKEATVEAYNKVKDKVADATAHTKEKMADIKAAAQSKIDRKSVV